MITRNFILHLTAGLASPLVINVNQYDQGEQWLFTLYNQDGTQYVPSSGAIVGIKSDNLGIINSGTVDSQGRVVINETQQMTAAVGKAVFELVIDDGTHGTANFVVLVEPKPGDNADLSETDISMIEEAIEAASTIKPYGSPLVASTVADMTDHEKVYVYVGSETGYTSGNWYYWDGDSWESGGVYNSVAVQTDTTLTLSGVAADAKKTGDEISDLKSQINNGVPREVKLALDAILGHALALNESCEDEYAIVHAWANAVNLVSISAVFNQGGNVIYDIDSLDSLKQYLTVTATYDDETTAVVTTYTLSGELTGGTSVITVAYDGKTTTFNVTVTAVDTIRVFKGKGTSGTSIVDNANRGLSEPVAMDSSVNRNVQFPSYSTSAFTFAVKVCTSDTAVLSTAPTFIPQSYIGTTKESSPYGTRVLSDELLYLGTKTSGVWGYYDSVGNGEIRLLFSNSADMSTPLTTTIEGVIYLNGIPYRLVEADIADFE